MRTGNLAARATIVTDQGLIDVATGSNGVFSTSVDKYVRRHGNLLTWFHGVEIDVTVPTTAGELWAVLGSVRWS